jgi:hypothetical protein
MEMAFALEELFSLEDAPMQDISQVRRVEDIASWVSGALALDVGQIPSQADLARLAKRYGAVWEPIA